MKTVIEMAREAGWDDHHAEFDTRIERFAELVRAEALAEQPAQQEPKIDIYRSFEQWKSGNVLEHGVPRTEHYSEAQLDLVEMGWHYGYDAGRAVEQALDKKAENARELGLDYEPAQDSGIVTAGGFDPRTQRTWVGLTPEELDEMFSKTLKGKKLVNWVARAIEAKLREKNNG